MKIIHILLLLVGMTTVTAQTNFKTVIVTNYVTVTNRIPAKPKPVIPPGGNSEESIPQLKIIAAKIMKLNERSRQLNAEENLLNKKMELAAQATGNHSSSYENRVHAIEKEQREIGRQLASLTLEDIQTRERFRVPLKK